jgi:hypothetical protein
MHGGTGFCAQPTRDSFRWIVHMYPLICQHARPECVDVEEIACYYYSDFSQIQSKQQAY